VATEAEKKSETSDYSGTKAPENKEHVESNFQTGDESLIPGGRDGTKTNVGMSELDRDTVPNGATDTGQTRYGNSSPAYRHRSDRDKT